jgi:hypothetical protein
MMQFEISRVSNVAAAVAFVLMLAGCGKTISWEEEVPLNSGEVIFIKRQIRYELRGGFGNPFDISMRPTRLQRLTFEYGGQQYEYTGRANLILLAISPAKVPVLVAPAGDFGWDKENKFSCVVPYYVQFIPELVRGTWTWREKPENWLYGLRANLMRTVPNISEPRTANFSIRDRDSRDSIYRLQFPPGAQILPNYSTNTCIDWSK